MTDLPSKSFFLAARNIVHEGNVFSRVSLFTGGVPMWTLPMMLSGHMGPPPDMLKLVHLENSLPHPPPDPFKLDKPAVGRPLKGFLVTARKWSCGKVMFLHLSVILFTDGGGVSQHAMGGVHPPGRRPWVDTPRDGHWSGRYTSYWNAFLFDMLSLVEN